MMELTVLEDWISPVATIPITSPANGFLAKSNSDFARSPAALANPAPIVETAMSNK